MRHIRSRIHQHIKPDLMKALKDICLDVKISDNNTKVRLIRETLEEFKLEYHELGPGTNRFAILIDGYVFKIAMDTWGVLDNDNEFSMTEVLQPYVTTVYETNGLISVSEYVTLIGKDEFVEKKSHIIKILSILSEGFLLGDVGYAPKNFANWGYRTDGSLVILDFAYIYNIVGDEIMCQKDGNILQYDENFNFMRCPYCRKKYDTIAIRRLISKEHELAEIQFSKNNAYSLKTELIEVDDEEEEVKDDKKKEEEIEMERDEFTEEEREEGFSNIFDVFNKKGKYVVEQEEHEIEPEDTEDDIISNVSKIVSSSPKDMNSEEEEYHESQDENDLISSVISVFSSGYKRDDEEPEEDLEEEIVEEETSNLTPLEIMAIAAGAAEPEDFDDTTVIVPEDEQHDFAKDDGVEDDPADYENPGQISYVLDGRQNKSEEQVPQEEPDKPIVDDSEHKTPIEEEVKEVPIVEQYNEERVNEKDIPIVEKELSPPRSEDIHEDEEPIMDGLEEEQAPTIKIPKEGTETEEEFDPDFYSKLSDGVEYPDDDNDEEVNNEEQPPPEPVKQEEKPKPSGIKRIGSTESPPPEEEEDLMSIVNKVHHSNNDDEEKYDKLAEQYLRRDPYDY